MMEIGIFMYEGSPLFEVIIAAYILNTKYNVTILTDQKNSITCAEGIKIIGCKSIDQVNSEDIDVLIISGGHIEKISNIDIVSSMIKQLRKDNKVIGAICAARDLVIDILDLNINIPDNTVVISDNIVLSPPNEYAEFGIKLGQVVEIYQDEDDYSETVKFFGHK